jgi:crotonobetainyl-CoA:carnitine CoA-transferase CaiB-like acyl-CoA transferase
MKVLDFSTFIAGPLGAMALSDLGADVIKVEPINGEGARLIPFLFLGGNRGKRGLAIDVKKRAGGRIMERLLQRSDVVVHNMRVGVAERMGIDYETARKLRPDVIYVHSAAYGSSGPDALKPGFDPLFQSMSGTTARQGAGSDRPVFLRTPVCDDTNGMLLAAAVLMALYHRDRTGQGQKVDLSLLNTGALVNSDEFMRYRGKQERPLADRDLYGLSAVYRLYKTAAGWIFLACGQPEEWELLKKSLGGPWPECQIPFDTANARHPWNHELCRDLSAEFARRRAGEWEQQLVERGVPCVKVAEDNQEGVFLNPQLLALGAVDRKGHPHFTDLEQPGVQVQFSETPPADRPAAPLLGQHTLEVLRELGFDDREIAEMEGTGCIAIHPDGN